MISISKLILTPVVMASMFACNAPAGSDESSAVSSDALQAPTSPLPALDVPAGNHVKFRRDATGVQAYVCTVSATATYSWVLYGPQANLFGRFGNLKGTHFAGPTWQANDGSSVKGTKLAAATVDTTAIPWLLLGVASHAGTNGQLSDVSFVQRFNTTGGLAPAENAGCDMAHGGAIAAIPYTATYYFYAPNPGSPAIDD